jgi:hypothetical protein
MIASNKGPDTLLATRRYQSVLLHSPHLHATFLTNRSTQSCRRNTIRDVDGDPANGTLRDG